MSTGWQDRCHRLAQNVGAGSVRDRVGATRMRGRWRKHSDELCAARFLEACRDVAKKTQAFFHDASNGGRVTWS